MKSQQLKVYLWILFSVHCVSAHAIDASSKSKSSNQQTLNISNSNNQTKPSNLKELSPDTIQSIQLIGRSVLAAKHSEVTDPNVTQVKARLQTIRQNLDDVIKAEQVRSSNDLMLNSIASDTASKNLSSKNVLNNRTQQISGVDQDVDKRKHGQSDEQKINTLKQHLSEIKNDNYPSGQVLTDYQENEHQPQMQHLINKSQNISDEIDVALTDTSPERLSKLMKLRDRLTVKTLVDIQPEKPIAEETPTISTITRHRD